MSKVSPNTLNKLYRVTFLQPILVQEIKETTCPLDELLAYGNPATYSVIVRAASEGYALRKGLRYDPRPK